jgi:hypothetical protein
MYVGYRHEGLFANEIIPYSIGDSTVCRARRAWAAFFLSIEQARGTCFLLETPQTLSIRGIGCRQNLYRHVAAESSIADAVHPPHRRAMRGLRNTEFGTRS